MSSLRQTLASPSVWLAWSFALLSHVYDGMQVYHKIYSIFWGIDVPYIQYWLDFQEFL